MRSTDSKNSSPKHEPEISPAIAIDAKTGAMRDISSAPSAVPPVSPGAGPSMEFSHRTTAYGATIETTLDHTGARLTPVDGPAVEFASNIGAETSAFQRAIREAKRDWKLRVEAEQESTLDRRNQLISAAAAKNQRG